jgi:hypothetical protein
VANWVAGHLTSPLHASFTVTDVAVNHPPTITSMPPFVATVGQLYAYNATATDPDGDVIEWRLLTAPAGMSISSTRRTIRWTPTADQVGSQSVTLQAVDPYGGSATQRWTITVHGVNQPPVITSEPPTQAQVNKLYYYGVQASDPDGDALSYSVSISPGTFPCRGGAARAGAGWRG